MRATGRAAWNGNAATGAIYRVTDAEHSNSRVGNCWAKGRLKDDDLLLCYEQSGDCFYDYYLLDSIKYANKEGTTMRIVPYRIGAYQFGELAGTPTSRQYHLLMAGNEVEVTLS